MKTSDVKIWAFDADDTLWDCQSHFERAEQHLCELLAPWADADTAARELFKTESKNMPMLGYGTKAFTLSVIETAVRVSGGKMSAAAIGELMQMGYALLSFPTTPLPGVESTLQTLAQRGTHMVVFTKGELQDQENKLARSGLAHYFEYVEITSNKGESEFRSLCRKLGVAPHEMLMVGNSFKSDIAPALRIGAWAAHIPFHVTWQLEHAEEFDHEQLIRLARFDDLLSVC